MTRESGSMLGDARELANLQLLGLRAKALGGGEMNNDEMTALWNGTAGAAWIESQTMLDELFRPFEALLVREAMGATRVLDVGCGTGATTLAIGQALAGMGSCLGVDVSAPMVARAKERVGPLRNVEFACADAGVHRFEPGSFDLIVSRFGVMFFSDPVAAFANLLAATRPGARLNAIAWRSPAENPFMTAAERAAAPLLPSLAAARKPNAPGQFAFADGDRVRGLLEQAGWATVEVRRLDVECAMPSAALTGYLTRMGPLGQALRDVDEATREKVWSVVQPAFDSFRRGDEVRFTAACWELRAAAQR